VAHKLLELILIHNGSVPELLDVLISAGDYNWSCRIRARECICRCIFCDRKVAVSIPEGVNGIFHRYNPSNHTRALGSTQPLTPPSCADSFEIWELQPPGTLKACPSQGLLYLLYCVRSTVPCWIMSVLTENEYCTRNVNK